MVTQNGGVDFSRTDLEVEASPFEPVEPGLQHVDASGAVVYLARGLQAPNDLVVASDSTVYCTDPHHRRDWG